MRFVLLHFYVGYQLRNDTSFCTLRFSLERKLKSFSKTVSENDLIFCETILYTIVGELSNFLMDFGEGSDDEY